MAEYYEFVIKTRKPVEVQKDSTIESAYFIPKHGDLKDVSVLLHYLAHMHGATEHDNDLLREFEKMIRECPTVVEATE